MRIGPFNKHDLQLIVIAVLFLLLVSFLSSCSTLSTSQCDRFVGVEREECIKRVVNIQYQQLDLGPKTLPVEKNR